MRGELELDELAIAMLESVKVYFFRVELSICGVVKHFLNFLLFEELGHSEQKDLFSVFSLFRYTLFSVKID